MKTLKKLFTLCSLALVFALILTADSFAGGQQGLMNVAAGKAVNIFNHVKMIIFVVGGFGLVGVAWGCIWGKINWKWFGALAVGLAIVAAAASIVDYATGQTMTELN